MRFLLHMHACKRKLKTASAHVFYTCKHMKAKNMVSLNTPSCHLNKTVFVHAKSKLAIYVLMC